MGEILKQELVSIGDLYTYLSNSTDQGESNNRALQVVSQSEQPPVSASDAVDEATKVMAVDQPTNIANMMGVQIRIRDRQMHQQLSSDASNNFCFYVFILKSMLKM
ncbi:hypothetical protein Bca4012_026511 [Brassica carinata]|uniref:Uncharacterized protein n=1 Tax=Brassica carinata TaxID=52824 RepID=A0A8X7VJ94_BRACI|nr:hypothetical protein Bca52824_023542 [Brassica carinata]